MNHKLWQQGNNKHYEEGCGIHEKNANNNKQAVETNYMVLIRHKYPFIIKIINRPGMF